MNPTTQETPMPGIGTIHAEAGKLYHVHKSSLYKERKYVEMLPYKVRGDAKDKDNKKVSYREDGIICPKCYQVIKG